MSDHVVRVTSPTEARNPRTTDIDSLPTLGILGLINDEDATVAAAVRAVLPEVATLVDEAVKRLEAGGGVHYFGAGTSGRMAVLDAAELPPTYGLDPDTFVAHLAGGADAVGHAREGVEDDETRGGEEAEVVGGADLAIGVAASGYTSYVRGALVHAASAGAHTALVTSNPSAPLAAIVDTVVCVDTGPEAITGSTRMKAATAQKLVLNAFSTAVMVLSGRTWSNLMVNVQPTNAKLRGRVITMLSQATGCSDDDCERALADSGNESKTALLVLVAGVTPARARRALDDGGGRVAHALRDLSP